MKKVSIISPVFENTNRISETISGLLDIFKEKYNFEVLYFYTGLLPKNLPSDEHFRFFESPLDATFDDCVTLGFSKVDGDCTIVADLNNTDYKEYIVKLLMEWEKNSQIVLAKQEKKNDTFWQKVGNFFRNIESRLYDVILGLAGLNKDYKTFRTFQLFSKEVADIIKEFPEKNYYLRNFDCWVDYNVSIIYSKDFVKETKKLKVVDNDFICFLSAMSVFVCILLLTLLISKYVSVESKSLFFLISTGLLVASMGFGLYSLFNWFVHRATELPIKKNK